MSASTHVGVRNDRRKGLTAQFPRVPQSFWRQPGGKYQGTLWLATRVLVLLSNFFAVLSLRSTITCTPGGLFACSLFGGTVCVFAHRQYSRDFRHMLVGENFRRRRRHCDYRANESSSFRLFGSTALLPRLPAVYPHLSAINQFVMPG